MNMEDSVGLCFRCCLNSLRANLSHMCSEVCQTVHFFVAVFCHSGHVNEGRCRSRSSRAVGFDYRFYVELRRHMDDCQSTAGSERLTSAQHTSVLNIN